MSNAGRLARLMGLVGPGTVLDLVDAAAVATFGAAVFDSGRTTPGGAANEELAALFAVLRMVRSEWERLGGRRRF